MQIAKKISSFNRQRKWEIFIIEIQPHASSKVLDVGYSNKEYSTVDNFIEKNYSHPSMLTALGIEPSDEFVTRYPLVNAVQYDGSEFPFNNTQFDVCWSNAVIEHVGEFEKQLLFMKEIKRVSRKAFITTPNKWFPIEVHTRTPLLHFLPKRIFEKYLKIIGKSWATGDYMHLLGKKELIKLLDLAGINEYKIIPNKLLGFTMDFIVIF
jgi:SAM-dependent methyltransferase